MCTNKHYYCMFNGITVTTSYIIDEEYKKYICVRFERPNNNNGFDFAEIIMPDKKFIKAFGFSEDEIYWIESLAADNLLLIWEIRLPLIQSKIQNTLRNPFRFDKKQDKTYNKHKETTGCGKPVLLIV